MRHRLPLPEDAVEPERITVQHAVERKRQVDLIDIAGGNVVAHLFEAGRIAPERPRGIKPGDQRPLVPVWHVARLRRLEGTEPDERHLPVIWQERRKARLEEITELIGKKPCELEARMPQPLHPVE